MHSSSFISFILNLHLPTYKIPLNTIRRDSFAQKGSFFLSFLFEQHSLLLVTFLEWGRSRTYRFIDFKKSFGHLILLQKHCLKGTFFFPFSFPIIKFSSITITVTFTYISRSLVYTLIISTTIFFFL